MGYYTLFSFSHINGPKEQYDKMLKDVAETLGDKDVTETESTYAKWYDYDKDIRELSKKYPDITFCVSGDGEDSEDLWQEFWHAGEVFQEGVEFSSFKDIESHMSPGLALIQRAERELFWEINHLVENGEEITSDDEPVFGYIIDNVSINDTNPNYDKMVEMEVKHLNVSEGRLLAFMTLPGEKEYTKEEALALPEQKNSLCGWYELNPRSFYGLFLPTLCNIRKALKKPNNSLSKETKK